MKLDIKDFEPAGVACLGSGQPWVGMGKHLCGAGTDFALLCMARCAANPSGDPSSGAEPHAIRGLSTRPKLNAQLEFAAESAGARSSLQGFGIATCCHHRCSWAHYVGRSLFQEHGLSEQDFQLVTWMTGMAQWIPVSCL